MRRHLSAFLLVPLLVQTGSLAQKTPPAPAPPRGGSGASPFPAGNLDRLDSNLSRLQRALDAERMAAPEPVTPSQIDEALKANRGSGDARLAAILSGLTLTGRVAGARLSSWNTAAPGAQTRQLLTALADGSAFFALPTEDLPAAPTPSLTEQKRIITQVGHYLSTTLPTLPNFRATRYTTYFQDRPPRALPLNTDPASDDIRLNRPMHAVGSSRIQVAYASGREVVEKKNGFDDPDVDVSRFTTAGEFGPILYGVMMDAARSKIVWTGWELGRHGLLAVFRFDTPKEKSHFSLKAPGASGAADQFVAYGGEIAVDPADGTIMRLAVIAQPEPKGTIAAANIEVEYGPVEIGKHFYTCPVHAVALSKVRIQGVRPQESGQPVPLQTQINDVLFEQYHVFRGDPRVIQEGVTP